MRFGWSQGSPSSASAVVAVHLARLALDVASRRAAARRGGGEGAAVAEEHGLAVRRARVGALLRAGVPGLDRASCRSGRCARLPPGTRPARDTPARARSVRPCRRGPVHYRRCRRSRAAGCAGRGRPRRRWCRRTRRRRSGASTPARPCREPLPTPWCHRPPLDAARARRGARDRSPRRRAGRSRGTGRPAAGLSRQAATARRAAAAPYPATAAPDSLAVETSPS